MVSLRLFTMSVLVAGSLLVPKMALADEVLAGTIFDVDKENETVQMARKHTYLGGRDESDLVVQPQLSAPTRKMTPQSEAEKETGADDAF